jgi:hypothetical protein
VTPPTTHYAGTSYADFLLSRATHVRAEWDALRARWAEVEAAPVRNKAWRATLRRQYQASATRLRVIFDQLRDDARRLPADRRREVLALLPPGGCINVCTPLK